jgi:hypothetical protein
MMWPGWHPAARIASGSHPVEGGPHEIFETSTRPVLTVDIGYADLTIITRKTSQIDVAVRQSTDFGLMRSTAPITARKDGETVHITTARPVGWSVGDDRMVTVIVPPETQVNVVSAGDIRANGLRGEASFSATGSGTVTVEDYDAPTLHVASWSGDISLHRIVATRIDATSREGNVEAGGLQVRDGSVESKDGGVTLGFAAGADALVTAWTRNGRIHVSGFGATDPATITRRSTDDDRDGDSSQTVRIGAANGRLDVHSRNGDVELIGETPPANQ